MSDSVRPQRRQSTRLPCPWNSLGKNTGVGCHFLLQCIKVKSESEVAQSCPTPSNPMDCRLPDSSVHGIFQARVLEWGAIAFSMLFTRMEKSGYKSVCEWVCMCFYVHVLRKCKLYRSTFSILTIQDNCSYVRIPMVKNEWIYIS